MDDGKGRVIAAFLRYFNDDPERAVAAIRQYTTRNSDAQTKTAVPLGSEIISAKDVVKTYKVGRQKIEVLRGVSLSVRQREFVALTGASGSGKSTLLQLIGGLDKPTSGLIIRPKIITIPRANNWIRISVILFAAIFESSDKPRNPRHVCAH